MPKRIFRKMYVVQDLAFYNRVVELPNGHTIRFKEFYADVSSDDITYFNRDVNFQTREVEGKWFEQFPKEELEKSIVPALIEAEGLLFGVSGFAEAMRNVVYSLYKKGLIMRAQSFDGEGADGAEVTETKKGKILKDLATKAFEFEKGYKPPTIDLQMTIPLGIKRKLGKYNIAYIMFETQKWPKQFQQSLMNEADEIWTPSSFNVNNIKEAGWKRPIYRMPLGVDTERFDPTKIKPFIAEESPIGKLKDKFVFLSIMGWSERKGVSPLLEAFLKEFKPEEKVALYIKGGWFGEEGARTIVNNAIRDHNTNPPQVEVDFKIYSDKEHPRLYKSANAFILPSLGEGWGLNYTEAMAMELPTLGTAATSMTDFMNETNSFPIAVKRYGPDSRCDWISRDYIGQDFAIPDVDSIRKQMRYVFDNQEKAKQIGIKARQDMINQWTWEEAGERYVERLKEIAKTL